MARDDRNFMIVVATVFGIAALAVLAMTLGEYRSPAAAQTRVTVSPLEPADAKPTPAHTEKAAVDYMLAALSERDAAPPSTRHEDASKVAFASLVGSSAFRQRDVLPVLHSTQLRGRRTQKLLVQLVFRSVVFEFHRHLRVQRPSPRPQGLDLLARHAVVVEQSAHQRQHQRGFADPVRAVNDVQSVGKWCYLDRRGKASPALDLYRTQNHLFTS